MKTAAELKRDLDGITTQLDKHLTELMRIKGDIQDIERAACKDMSFSLREILDVRKLLPIVERKICSGISTRRKAIEREQRRES